MAYGPVTIVHFSTERSMAADSPQYLWLSRTLRAVDRSVTPWVIAQGHRPMYVDEPVACDPFLGCGDVDGLHYYWNLLDPLFTETRVDLVYAGHHHVTQRHCAAYQGRCTMNSTLDPATGANVYDGPQNPVHYTIGNAGAGSDTPGARSPGTGALFTAWEAPNTAYARARADGAALTVEIVDARTHAVLDTSVIRKAVPFALGGGGGKGGQGGGPRAGAPAATNAILLSVDGMHEADLE